MKLTIITNYLGNRGGLGRYSKEIVNALKDFPIEMNVITEEKILLPIFRKDKITTIKNVIINTVRVWRLTRDSDVIHAHDGWPYAIYAWVSVLGTKKKLFITGVGTYTVAPLKSGLRSVILKKAYRRANQIFCISDYVKNKILNYCRDAKTTTVFMGTTKLPQVTEEDIAKCKKDYNLEKSTPIFLTVGDIKNRKGQLDTLKGLLLLKNKYPNFKYIMVGDDEDVSYVDQIKSFAKENDLINNIQIVPKIYDDKVLSSFYSICDIFMLNSNNDGEHFEGFGLVFLEAAQFGKPVIGSSDCGIENALKDGYNGFLVKQKGYKEISEAVVRILEKERGRFSINSKEFYKNFSWKKTAEIYYNNYKN